ncbi:MAG TPA: GYD domain-containing protein [Candidatus Dormibacteraeota bacterium]|nr:GYD domain-containing protein [Candidatus Dormibacteraeota bacterium]
MPKYLIKASFTPEAIRGVIKEGGTARRKAVDQSVASLGGKVEAFYFAFGTTDTYTILDLASNADMAALAGTIGASGAVKIETVVLLTPAEIDDAAKKKVSYRPPGA